MGADDFLDDGQAQARALLATRRFVAQLLEGPEQPVHLARRNTRPFIGDGEGDRLGAQDQTVAFDRRGERERTEAEQPAGPRGKSSPSSKSPDPFVNRTP